MAQSIQLFTKKFIPNFPHGFYNHLPIRRTVFSLFVGLLALISWINPIYAQDSSFVVEGVEVDVTADDAVKAREEAFEAVQIKAYEQLAKRKLSEEAFAKFSTPDINKISALVKDFEVTNEKLSTVRYNGTYTITFRPHTIAGAGVVQASTTDDMKKAVSPSADTLVLPVVKRDGRHYLWNQGPYRMAWAQAIGRGDLQSFALPSGDAQDIAALRDDEIMSYDYGRVSRMMERYGVKKAAIVVTDPQASENGKPAANIKLYRVTPSGPSLIKSMMLPLYEGETPDDIFPRVVAQSTMVLKNQPVPSTRPQVADLPPMTGPRSTLTAQLGFNSVREWVDVKRSIERARGVSGLTVKSMSARSAVVDIAYQGDMQTLSQGLNQVRLNLAAPIVTANNYGRPPLYQISKIR